MHVTVFGLGEAGALLAADLSTAGVDVTGFDPAPVATPEGVARSPDAAAAVADADIVLIVTGAQQAADVFDRIVAHLPADCLVADLSTSAPDAKAARAAAAAAADRSFVDVALMAPVPGRGLGTPSLASGAGAERYGAAMRPLGAPVELVGERAGAASTRKLLRSVTMKGLASVVIEALRAAERAGLSDWLWSDLVAEFESADEALLRAAGARHRRPCATPGPRDGGERRDARLARRRAADDQGDDRIAARRLRATAFRLYPIRRSRRAVPGCRRGSCCGRPRSGRRRRGGRRDRHRQASAARSGVASRCPTGCVAGRRR